MAMAMEFLGLAPPGSSVARALTGARTPWARRRGAGDGHAARNLRPRDIATRHAFENAIHGVVASGGSTNAVLHLLAIAREAGVELEIDDFDRISRARPDLRPQAGGRFVAVDLDRAGASSSSPGAWWRGA